jgi:hypothetical protein
VTRAHAVFIILGLLHMGQGQGQPAPAAKANECEPWPLCRVTKTPLQPGSPTTGLNAALKIDRPDGVLSKDYKPDTMRVPMSRF